MPMPQPILDDDDPRWGNTAGKGPGERTAPVKAPQPLAPVKHFAGERVQFTHETKGLIRGELVWNLRKARECEIRGDDGVTYTVPEDKVSKAE